MKRRCSSLLRFILCTGILTTWLCPEASPAETQEQWVARAVSVQGTVESQRVGEPQWQPVKLNDTFRRGDKIGCWKEAARTWPCLTNRCSV